MIGARRTMAMMHRQQYLRATDYLGIILQNVIHVITYADIGIVLVSLSMSAAGCNYEP